MALEAEFATRAGVGRGLVKGAQGLSVTRGVRVPRTAQLALPEGHPLRASARLASKTLVKVYDRDDAGARVLKHVGPITSYRRSAEDQVSTQLGSTDAAWYLDRRLLQVSNSNQLLQKRGHILKWVVMALMDQTISDAAYNVTDPTTGYRLYDLVRTQFAWGSGPVFLDTGAILDTGVRVRTIADTPSVLIESQPYMKASALFGLATQGLDGPDWAIYPSEPTADANGVAIGNLDVAPVIGTTRANVIFEYGAGKRNVSAFEEIIDPNTQANSVAANTPTGSLHSYDRTAYLDQGGPLEDVFQTQIASDPYSIGGVAGSGPGGMVMQLIQDHLAVRKVPRQVITFTVAADVEPGQLDLAERRVPRPGVDYDFGDVVTFRATEQVPVYADDGSLIAFTPEKTVDALFRVYGLTESDDDNGQRVTQLVVVAS